MQGGGGKATPAPCPGRFVRTRAPQLAPPLLTPLSPRFFSPSPRISHHPPQALMGKVKQAVRCVRQANGEWVMSQPPQVVAVKQLYKVCISRGVTMQGHRVKENPLQEAGVLMHLSSSGGHPNVLRMLDMMEDNDCLYIVLEFLQGGELFDAVAHGQMNEDRARDYFLHMVEGSRYMHACGVGHRDLSLENALLSYPPGHRESTAKIIDFGLAVKLPTAGAGGPDDPFATRARLPADGRVGKEKYMPPEVFSLLEYEPVAVDAWELGVCLFVLLFGVHPFQQANADRCPYFRAISEGHLPTLLREWGFDKLVSPAALDLLVFLMQADPARRPLLSEVAAHPWMGGAVEMPAAAGEATAGALGAGAGTGVGGAPSSSSSSSDAMVDEEDGDSQMAGTGSGSGMGAGSGRGGYAIGGKPVAGRGGRHSGGVVDDDGGPAAMEEG
jgi:hypothetical protein